MTAAQQVRALLAGALEEKGVQTLAAWEREKLLGLEGAVAVLGVAETESSAAAFWNYLGEEWDEEASCFRERYGRRMRMTLCAEFYAPRNGVEEIEACCGTLEEALSAPLPGVQTEKVQRGEISFDRTGGYLKCRCTVLCTAYFTAARAEEGAALTDFRLKGVLQ